MKLLKSHMPSMFWDVNPDRIDPELDKEWLIERALYMSFLEQDQVVFEKLEEVYGIPIIHSVVKQARDLRGNETIQAICNYFPFSPSDFPNWIDLSKHS